MNNNSSNREQKPAAAVAPLGFPERVCVCSRVCRQLSLRKHLPALCEGIDSPQGREDVSPCMDQIDNAGLNLALRQESGKQAIFSRVYSWVYLN